MKLDFSGPILGSTWRDEQGYEWTLASVGKLGDCVLNGLNSIAHRYSLAGFTQVLADRAVTPADVPGCRVVFTSRRVTVLHDVVTDTIEVHDTRKLLADAEDAPRVGDTYRSSDGEELLVVTRVENDWIQGVVWSSQGWHDVSVQRGPSSLDKRYKRAGLNICDTLSAQKGPE